MFTEAPVDMTAVKGWGAAPTGQTRLEGQNSNQA